MDERSFSRRPGFDRIAGDLRDAFGQVSTMIETDLSPRRIAAE
jgi:hypothetical protein